MSLYTAVAVLTLIFLGVILWVLWKQVRSPLPLEMQQALEKKEQAKLDGLKDEWSKRLAAEVSRIWEQVHQQVRTTEDSVSQKLQQANDTFASVTREIGRLQEATKKVEEVGRNVSSLQDLLRAPKMRGGLGEFFLADLLAQIMPADFYALQYEFSDGTRVDAVIRLRDKFVPIDSKFPLEQFQKMGRAVTDEERQKSRALFVRDIKQHIDAISEKYLRPSEGSYDFALMYIPAENVYYETIIKEDGVSDEKGLFQHALRRHVIPVSPNSFYAYLQVILQGLRGFAVEERALEILTALIHLQKELEGVREDFTKAGKQLGFAVDNFEKAQKHLNRFGEKLTAIEAPPETVAVLPGPKDAQLQEV